MTNKTHNRILSLLLPLLLLVSVLAGCARKELPTADAPSLTVSIECTALLSNPDALPAEKASLIPSDGIILPPQSVTFTEGESAFDVLQRVCRENNIHLEFTFTPLYDSAYIEGIHNLYEFDCGSGSGWMYCVNQHYPHYGCSSYIVQPGDTVIWRYTCSHGTDIGADTKEVTP